MRSDGRRRDGGAVHANAVADVGGLLVLGGLLEGEAPAVGEVLGLDTTCLALAEYLVLRHEGAPQRVRVEYKLATAAVSEWFPVRALALDAATAAVADDEMPDAHAPLLLAESLGVPLVTKNRGLTSPRVPVLHC